MGRVFDELEEWLLLLECAHNIDLTILHLVNLEGKFNDMSFGVGIFIYNYFKCFLIWLTTRVISWVLVDNSFWRFDGGGWVKKFNISEYNEIFLCNICSLFFYYCSNFQCHGCGVTVIDNFYYFYMCDSAMKWFGWVCYVYFIDICIFRIVVMVGSLLVDQGWISVAILYLVYCVWKKAT